VEDEKVSRISYIAELKGKQGGRNSLSQPALCLQPPTAGRIRFSGRKGSCEGAGFVYLFQWRRTLRDRRTT
jgi:hypothetical protein